ncbi:MFS transporter [Actinokineospora sp. PR83]|uniref:MFS transporter n=1 Tax=Actinokineospora sp. PR83 TaxID=2884908 RepID=UPI0027E19215|nr:MFS transporter [Actinokineospora sp. PR83]MCG8917330.1 MFS transporter [Actinokineospora sp. PR83]
MSTPTASPPAFDRPAHSGALGPLVLGAAIGSTGLAAGGTAGALLIVDLTGSAALAGVPTALHLGGSAVGALLVSWEAARGHRGRGLALGFGVGALGAALVVVAAALGSLALVLLGSMLLGTANSSIFLTRYAAAVGTTPGGRGKALGRIFLATAVGAVISPLLLGPSGRWARSLGLPPPVGLYLVALLAFAASALLYLAASNPRVPVLGRAAVVLGPSRVEAERAPRATGLLRDRGTRTALLALALTNLVMVGVMTIAPIHLVAHGAGEDMVGGLIALHVLAMFAVGPISGAASDRFGPNRVVAAGALLLAVAGAVGLLVNGHGVLAMVVHLVVLGVGWNCGVVGASALLVAAVPGPLRPKAEGIGEVTMGLGAAAAAPAAGVAADLGGYSVLAAGVCAVAVLGGAALLTRGSNSRRHPGATG